MSTNHGGLGIPLKSYLLITSDNRIYNLKKHQTMKRSRFTGDEIDTHFFTRIILSENVINLSIIPLICCQTI